MRELSPGTVICLALGLVAAINGLLVLGLIRGRSQREISLLGRAVRSARSPWKKDEEAIDELHRRVSQLGDGAVNGERAGDE